MQKLIHLIAVCAVAGGGCSCSEDSRAPVNQPSAQAVDVTVQGIKRELIDAVPAAAGMLVLGPSRISEPGVEDTANPTAPRGEPKSDPNTEVKSAIVELVKAARAGHSFRLRDPEEEKAIDAVLEFGEVAVPELAALLENSNRHVRYAATKALTRFGPDAKDAVPGLIRRLQVERYVALVADARQALVEIGPVAIPPLVQEAKRSKGDTLYYGSDEALRVLWTMSLQNHYHPALESVLPDLLSVFQNSSRSEARFHLLNTLNRMGPAAKKSLPILTAALNDDKYAKVHVEIAETMWEVGQDASPVLPVLVEILKDQTLDVWRRAAAARVLKELDTAGGDAVPALIACLAHEDGYLRSSAASALGRIGIGDQSVAKYLMTLLSDDNKFVRSSAARSLGGLKTNYRTVLPLLLQVLRDDREPDVRSSAAKAIAALGTHTSSAVDAVVDALVQTLEEDVEDTVRRSAADALGELGGSAKEALPALERASHDRVIGLGATLAIGRIRGTAVDTAK